MRSRTIPAAGTRTANVLTTTTLTRPGGVRYTRASRGYGQSRRSPGQGARDDQLPQHDERARRLRDARRPAPRGLRDRQRSGAQHRHRPAHGRVLRHARRGHRLRRLPRVRWHDRRPRLARPRSQRLPGRWRARPRRRRRRARRLHLRRERQRSRRRDDDRRPGQLLVHGSLPRIVCGRLQRARRALVFFDGTVNEGESYEVRASNGGRSELESSTFIHVLDAAGSAVLQHI